MNSDKTDHTVVIRHTPVNDLLHELNSCESGDEAVEKTTNWINSLRKGTDKDDTSWLTLDDVVKVCRQNDNGRFASVVVDPALLEFDPQIKDKCDAKSSVQKSYLEAAEYIRGGKKIYGVNTGFGSNRKYKIEDGKDIGRLSANILFSHAVGTGRPLPVDIVKGIMLLRIRTFCQGFSGIHPMFIEKLVEMLNHGIVPYIPEKGSVGSSGDLAPLAHLFLVMIGYGRAWVIGNSPEIDYHFDDRREQFFRKDENRPGLWNEGNHNILLEGSEIWQAAGLNSLHEDDLLAKDSQGRYLGAKVGLAFTNGATVSAASLALSVHDAINLYDTANACGAISLQAVSGHTRAFELVAQTARPQIGQIKTSWEMLRLLKGSTFTNRCAYNYEAQDDYSIRAIPQVHGAVWNALDHVRTIAEIEINSATDNPLFCSNILKSRADFTNPIDEAFFNEAEPFDGYRATLDTTHCSAANFHGEPVATALDYLKIAMSELASISERRIQLLLDANHNRILPANLTPGKKGLHTGFMIFQYSAASLVSENKVLSHPSSVDSIPTSANCEDHVSMATNAERHLRTIIKNVSNVLSIELICGLQAIDIRTHFLKDLLNTMIAKDGYSDLPSFVRDLEAGNDKQKDQLRTLKMLLNFESTDELKTSPLDDQRSRLLSLSNKTRVIYDFIRDQAAIPFISSDGMPESETHNTLNISSFRKTPPVDMIARVSAEILKIRISERTG